MARKDSQGTEIIIGDRLHLYDDNQDYGTGTVVPGQGKALMIIMDPGCFLEGKHNLRDIANKNINSIVIGRKEPKPSSLEESFFTQKDLDNINYLISRGFSGSIKRITKTHQITITISDL